MTPYLSQEPQKQEQSSVENAKLALDDVTTTHDRRNKQTIAERWANTTKLLIERNGGAFLFPSASSDSCVFL